LNIDIIIVITDILRGVFIIPAGSRSVSSWIEYDYLYRYVSTVRVVSKNLKEIINF